MKPTPTWYAVYTKPKWEKKVSELLSKKGIENYCPLNKVLKQWHDRKKWVEEPLFTSYVFVRLTKTELTEAKKTPGVINFVYWLGRPAAVRDEEIETIQQFLNEYSGVSLERTHIKVADSVQIRHGAFANQEGTVIEVLHKSIKVMLPSLGYALVAQVDKAHVEVLKAAKEKAGKQQIRA